MSVIELAKMIGRTGIIFARGEMSVSVKIVDVKISYGATRYLVEPIAGRGSTWIDASSIELS